MKKKAKDVHSHLLEQCKKGNSAAQFKIYELYYKAMYNTALRISGNPTEAEDIMQEAFLSAFSKLDTLSGEVTFGAWLKQIVVNKALDFVKQRKIPFENIESQITDVPEQTANNSVDFSAEVSEVKQVLESLPEGYRIILSLYLIEGYDHDEIAGILQITASTSRSQLTRAKAKLRKQIEWNRENII